MIQILDFQVPSYYVHMYMYNIAAIIVINKRIKLYKDFLGHFLITAPVLKFNRMQNYTLMSGAVYITVHRYYI